MNIHIKLVRLTAHKVEYFFFFKVGMYPFLIETFKIVTHPRTGFKIVVGDFGEAPERRSNTSSWRPPPPHLKKHCISRSTMRWLNLTDSETYSELKHLKLKRIFFRIQKLTDTLNS